ncbi:hypothetical protein [Streptomyces sp. NPDC048442]|uniref:hypothetical protein n=1 Tax=Streptomyces sp. NPDC048442 TaxID=3154823 RepID=UPI003417F1A8
MTMEHVEEMVMAALVVRVFGRDVIVWSRRIAAAGVRAGISEMHRSDLERGQE